MRPYHYFLLFLAIAAGGCSLQDPVECTGNVSKCTNDSGVGLLFTCINDSWSEPVACEGNALCADDGITCQPPKCTPSSVRCTNTQTGGVIEKCNEQHQWETSATCEESMDCLDAVSCQTPDRCTPGNTKCTDTETGGILSACDETGHWKTLEPCKNNQKCSDAFSCETNACTPGQTSCVNNDISGMQIGNLLTCEETAEWSKAVACPGNAMCRDAVSCAEVSETAPKCTRDGDKCQNIGDTSIGQIIHCEDGEYSFSACKDNSSCRDDEHCGECTDGSKVCKDGAIYQCTRGIFEKLDSCETGECFDETRCLQCSTRCTNSGAQGQLIYECEGRAPVITPCDGVSCNPDTNDCGECMNPIKGPGTSCQNNETGHGLLSGCRGGKKFKDEPCSNEASCYDSAVCGSCRNGSTVCTTDNNKSYLQVCEQGSINTSGSKASCPNGSTCDKEGKACEGIDSVCGYYGNGSIGRVFYSNGTYKDCDNVSCNPDMTECGECKMNTAGPSQSCKNNEDGVGIINGCVNGILYEDVPCKDNVSCNNQGNISCGNCHSGDWKCEEDDSGTGIISICVGGLWNSGMGIQSFQCPAGKGCTDTGCADSTKTMCVTSNNKGYIAFKQDNGYVRYTCKHECNNNNTDCVCEAGEIRCEETATGIGVLSECIISSDKTSYWGEAPSVEPQKYSCKTTGCNKNSTFCDTDKKEFCVSRTTRPIGYLATNNNNTVTIDLCPSNNSCTPDNTCGDCIDAVPTLCNDGVISKCETGVLTKTPCKSGVCKDNYNCD